MKDMLDEIVAYKRKELKAMKSRNSMEQIFKEVNNLEHRELPSLKEALLNSQTGIIAEFKRRSPSKGWIKEAGRPEIIPLEYQKNGAAALSILTDEHFFGGADEFITKAGQAGVTLPILYKNFVIDEYQLYQARKCGASAVLLIAAILTKKECKELIDAAHRVNLEVLLEIHKEQELEYVELEPDLCGVNNRNLGSFVTDVANSFYLAEKLPASICKVSESGISNPQSVIELRKAGFNGFLIGENFMRAERPGAELKEFINKLLS